MTTEGRELGWDEPIENDGMEFVTLPEGDYDFEVVEYERGRHAGSDKLPPCNKAIVHIKVKGAEGQVIIKHQLFLHTITEGMICAFFTGIGQRKRGEKFVMNWPKVPGSKGRAKVGIYRWKNDKGEELTKNEIKKFYDPAEGPAKGFEAGRF